MLHYAASKRRSLLTHSSRYANCGARARFRAAESRSQFSGRLDKSVRLTSCGLASHPSRSFGRLRPDGQEWEAVQATLLAARPRFLRMAYAILRNKEDAEDAVQDALLSACLHLRTFEGRSALTTWFTRIVLNAALMIRRKRKPSWMDPLPEPNTTDDTPWTERIPASQPDPEMVYAEEETLQLIDVVLGRMSPVLRQAFTMTYYDEMSSREACALLGVSTGTFKSRLFRARRHLMGQAQRSLLAPIRRATQSPFSFGNVDFQPLPARSAEISSPEALL
ncbi:MAG: RNA polymerase sigma factor [Candidatus Acidiferrum sp.]